MAFGDPEPVTNNVLGKVGYLKVDSLMVEVIVKDVRQGKVGYLKVDSLMVEVIVKDVRQAYGRTDYQVTPTRGWGFQWVDAKRVTDMRDEL